jgi:hypothetical protein
LDPLAADDAGVVFLDALASDFTTADCAFKCAVCGVVW